MLAEIEKLIDYTHTFTSTKDNKQHPVSYFVATFTLEGGRKVSLPIKPIFNDGYPILNTLCPVIYKGEKLIEE